MKKKDKINKNIQPKAHVRTFGCQMNVNDSEYLIGQLLHLGYEMTDNLSDAEIVLINSCCVRKKVEQKIYSLIGKIRKIKMNKTELKLGLCGCLAQKENKNIFINAPAVDFLLGPSELKNLEDTIIKIRENKDKKIYCNHLSGFTLKNTPIKRGGKITALVQIMRGCDNFCSYCIVPYTRGPEQSREAEEIILEVRDLLKEGYKEIFLLGQNVNSYGKDLKKPVSFSDLLKRISRIDGVLRIRFITSHPKDLSFDLIETIKDEKKICNHIHLPIQSGSDKILRLMDRKYDLKNYKKIYYRIRSRIKDVSITTDIMVGFPGETDNDFMDTLAFFKEMEFDNMYSFIYSGREQAVSSLMPGQVPLPEKKERLWKLIELQKKIAAEINSRLEGKTVEVLVEGPSSKNIEGQLMGRSDTNKTVIFKGEKSLTGNLVNVKVIETDAWTLFGELVH